MCGCNFVWTLNSQFLKQRGANVAWENYTFQFQCQFQKIFDSTSPFSCYGPYRPTTSTAFHGPWTSPWSICNMHLLFFWSTYNAFALISTKKIIFALFLFTSWAKPDADPRLGMSPITRFRNMDLRCNCASNTKKSHMPHCN